MRPFSWSELWGVAVLWTTTVAGQPSEDREYILEVDHARSSIEIEANALGIAPATFRLEQFNAEVRIDEAEQDLRRAVFTFRYDSLSSGKTGRDRRVKKWLESDRYPEGRFEAQEFVSIEGERYAVGELTLHGQTRQARFRYELEAADGRATFDAEATIDYRDWGLPILRVLFFKVDPDLRITMSIRGEAKDQAQRVGE